MQKTNQGILQAVVELGIEFPPWGPVRASNELAKRGIDVSSSGVRTIWMRHDMSTIALRLRAMEAKVTQAGGILTEAQVQAPEKANEEQQTFLDLLALAKAKILAAQSPSDTQPHRTPPGTNSRVSDQG